MDSYWLRVHRRAFVEAASLLGLESRGKAVIKVVITVAIILALAFFGSTGASQDEMIARFAIIAIIVLLFPLIYGWKLLSIPAKMDSENIKEIKRLIEGKPNPRLSAVSDDTGAFFQIENFNADAEFTVKLEFIVLRVAGLPVSPAFAQWVDMVPDERRFIQAGGHDRVYLFSTHIQTQPFLKTIVFTWMARHNLCHANSTSWIPINGNPTVPPDGEIIVYVSSSPAMQGGSRVVKIGFEGSDIWIESGDAMLIE